MYRGAFLAIVVVFMTAQGAAAQPQFTCDVWNCQCTGRRDCGELISSGFCRGVLRCGRDYGLAADSCFCAFWKRRPLTPRVRCEEGTYSTITGTIERVDLEPARWLIWLSQGTLGGCIVDVIVTANTRPALSCKQGRKITASGRVFVSLADYYLMADSFRCR